MEEMSSEPFTRKLYFKEKTALFQPDDKCNSHSAQDVNTSNLTSQITIPLCYEVNTVPSGFHQLLREWSEFISV